MPDRLEQRGDILAFVHAARKAASDGNWFAALAVALTLPDVCGSIDQPGRFNSRERYSRWWDDYMAHHYWVTPDDGEDWAAHTYLDGLSAYTLRSSYLHAGSDDAFGSPQHYQKIRLLGPPSSLPFGFNIEEQTLNVSLEHMIEWICQAVEAWHSDRASDEDVQRKLTNLVTIIPSAITVIIRDPPQ